MYPMNDILYHEVDVYQWRTDVRTSQILAMGPA